MFYELKLLCPQKEGIFANVWIAATLGVKKLTKNQILNTDIVKTSKEIEEMIVIQSHRPKKRLSLRLAAILVNGATKIYMQQVITLQEEILSFLCYVKKPIKVTDETFIKPKSVKTKKRPRPKQLPRAPDEQEEQIEIPPGSFIRKMSDIRYTSTIAEEAKRVKSFGPGPVEWGDEFIREIKKLTELEKIQKGVKETSAIIQGERREVAEVPKRIEAEITALTGVLEEGRVETTAEKEQQDKEGTVPIIETPRKKNTREEDQIVAIETPKKRKIQQKQNETTKVDTPRKKKQREEDQTVEVGTPKKRRRLDYDTDENETTKDSTIKNIRRKQVNFKKQPQNKLINRIEDYGNELFDKWTIDNVISNLVRQERQNPGDVNFEYLISEFFKYESEFTPRSQTSGHPLAGTKSSALEKGSVSKLTPQKRRTATTPTLEGQFLQLALPGQLPAIVITSPQSSQIVPEIISHSQDFETVENPDEQLPPETVVVAVVAQKPLVGEQEHIKPLEKTHGSPAESFSSTENRRKTEEERQKLLAKKIHKWNEEEMGEITIEKICPAHINRQNIAKTFSDLLHLAKMGYVKLNNKVNSLELGKIEKGNKLLRN